MDTDQYLALCKRVPDAGPVEAWMYPTPQGHVIAQRSEDNPEHWSIVEHRVGPFGPEAYVCSHRLHEAYAREIAQAAQLASLAAAAVRA